MRSAESTPSTAPTPTPDESSGNSNSSGKPDTSQRRGLKSNASWADVYVAPFDRKGPGSRPEWDLRPRSLRDVSEEEKVCPCCSGTGYHTCTICNGNQFMIDGKFVTCEACHGKTKVPCSTCFGTLKQIELTESWWEKGFAALFGQK